jgi:hypothetical protein
MGARRPRTTPRPYWNKTVEELQELGTRHLLALLEGARLQPNVCSCGHAYHCGDEVLSEAEREENRVNFEFRVRVKAVLSTREHVARRHKPEPRKDKKEMRY